MKFVKSVELFKHLPKNIIVQLTGALHSEIYIAGDEIVKAGTHGEALYFISSGTVAVYNSAGKEVCNVIIIIISSTFFLMKNKKYIFFFFIMKYKDLSFGR